MFEIDVLFPGGVAMFDPFTPSTHSSGLPWRHRPYDKIVITIVERDTGNHHEFIAEYC